jgi:putative membrane protein
MAGTWLAGIITNPIPYCGTAPSPDSLLRRWNLDPVLITILAATFAVYLRGRRRIAADEASPWPGRLALAGWAIGVFALISPLCPLSVSLFAARVGQHMVLTLVAAPLIAIARPGAAMAAGLGLRWPSPTRSYALPASLAFMIMLWVWHAPAPYAATFASPLVYWLMHVTTFGSALWLWCEILNRRPGIAGFAAASLSMVQMGFLGALITLATRPAYAPHQLTTAAWGLTQLEDQQLGGAIMWVPGLGVFLVVISLIAWRAMRPLLDEQGRSEPAMGPAV